MPVGTSSSHRCPQVLGLTISLQFFFERSMSMWSQVWRKLSLVFSLFLSRGSAHSLVGQDDKPCSCSTTVGLLTGPPLRVSVHVTPAGTSENNLEKSNVCLDKSQTIPYNAPVNKHLKQKLHGNGRYCLQMRVRWSSVSHGWSGQCQTERKLSTNKQTLQNYVTTLWDYIAWLHPETTLRDYTLRPHYVTTPWDHTTWLYPGTTLRDNTLGSHYVTTPWDYTL